MILDACDAMDEAEVAALEALDARMALTRRQMGFQFKKRPWGKESTVKIAIGCTPRGIGRKLK